MKWRDLLTSLGREPVFSASLLQAGDVSRKELSVQLSRWVKSGHLIQLRRGVYAIARPYRKTEPHPFLVANSLCRNSYVSLQLHCVRWPDSGNTYRFVPVCPPAGPNNSRRRWDPSAIIVSNWIISLVSVSRKWRPTSLRLWPLPKRLCSTSSISRPAQTQIRTCVNSAFNIPKRLTVKRWKSWQNVWVSQSSASAARLIRRLLVDEEMNST